MLSRTVQPEREPKREVQANFIVNSLLHPALRQRRRSLGTQRGLRPANIAAVLDSDRGSRAHVCHMR